MMEKGKDGGGSSQMKNNQAAQEAIMKRKQEILNREFCCSICGTKLQFTHFIDYDSKRIKESAVCNECGVR